MSTGTLIRDAIAAAIGIALLAWAVRTQEPEDGDGQEPR